MKNPSRGELVAPQFLSSPAWSPGALPRLRALGARERGSAPTSYKSCIRKREKAPLRLSLVSRFPWSNSSSFAKTASAPGSASFKPLEVASIRRFQAAWVVGSLLRLQLHEFAQEDGVMQGQDELQPHPSQGRHRPSRRSRPQGWCLKPRPQVNLWRSERIRRQLGSEAETLRLWAEVGEGAPRQGASELRDASHQVPQRPWRWLGHSTGLRLRCLLAPQDVLGAPEPPVVRRSPPPAHVAGWGLFYARPSRVLRTANARTGPLRSHPAVLEAG
jgi:hypothetical protein